VFPFNTVKKELKPKARLDLIIKNYRMILKTHKNSLKDGIQMKQFTFLIVLLLLTILSYNLYVYTIFVSIQKNSVIVGDIQDVSNYFPSV